MVDIILIMSNDLHVVATIKRQETVVLVYHLDNEQFFVFDDTTTMSEQMLYQIQGEIKENKFVFHNIISMLKQLSKTKYKELYDDALRRGYITSEGIAELKEPVKEEKIMTKEDDIAIAEKIEEEEITIVQPVEKIEEVEIAEVSLVEASELSTSVVGGLPSFAEIREYLDRYNFVKKNVVDRSDFHEYRNNKGEIKLFMKKSGFRKFIHAFGLSVQVVKREGRMYFDQTTKRQGIEYEVWARCTAPNGQFTEDVAICQQYEKNSNKSKHDILTTATTRAINRAISNLVAYGEVSAEEVMG